MIDELTSYLDREADRVGVRDTLADIESGVTAVPLRPQRSGARWFGPALVGAAAALVVVLAVAATRTETSTGQGVTGAAPLPVEATAPPAPELPVATKPALVPIPLPEGATLQGFTPWCTTRDGIEFDCVIEGYRNAGGYDDGGIDHTSEVQAVISAASVVTGGCRSTSADGSTWHCAVGQRAVELAMISAGFLGDWAPIGYAAG